MIDATLDDVKGRVASLEANWQRTDAKLDHLDKHIGQLATRQASTDAKIDSLVEAVRTVTQRDAQPTNWIGIAGFVLAVVVGGSGYVDLRLTPVADRLDHLSALVSSNGEAISERGEVIGAFTSRLIHLESEERQDDELRQGLEGRIGALEQKAAAAEISRKAMGDYIRQVDELGSRHWIGGEPQKATRVE